ncbi:MAG: NAD(P)H-dependent glycerol-3-phosphate dehydrogenase [Candidatus Omnitrophota bacterium]
MAPTDIAVIGDGGWGITLALLLFSKGCRVTVWGVFPDYAEEVKKTRESDKFLPGIRIPEGIGFTCDEESVAGKDCYVIAVPCQYLDETLRRFKGVIRGSVVSVVKGIESGSLRRPSQIICDILADVRMAVLSGPTIAYEVSRGMPSTCVISSGDVELARCMQDMFMTGKFRVYTCDDVTGVELAGALKNVIAIAAGISDGLGFGVNTKAALLTRGLVEIARLGTAMGANRETFNGLAGLGDLATTCMSPHSRNRWFGEEIAGGRTMAEVVAGTDMVVEGINTAKSAHELSVKYGVDMPISSAIYKVLYKDKRPQDAVRELMTRSPKSE